MPTKLSQIQKLDHSMDSDAYSQLSSDADPAEESSLTAAAIRFHRRHWPLTTPRAGPVINGPTGEEDLRSVEDALVHLSVLQRSQTTLRELVKNAHLDAGSNIRTTLSDNDEAIARLEAFLSACINRFPTALRATTNSCLKALQVLSTPELLEAILLYLSPLDLLQAIGICRATMQIFLASPKLLDQLQLRPHKHGYVSNKLSDNFPGFRVDLDDSRTNRGYASLRSPSWPGARFNDVPVVVSFRSRSDFAIGSRCRSMLVAQPRIKSMKGIVSCCSSRLYDYSDPLDPMPDHHLDDMGPEVDDDAAFPPPDAPTEQELPSEAEGHPAEDLTTESAPDMRPIRCEAGTDMTEELQIHCKTGITVGHVLDATEKIRQAHALCPHAPLNEHADDGTVRPKIRFATVLKLRKGDPYLAEKDKEEVWRRLEGIDPWDRKGVMEVYIASKKRAFENDWPILTFGEFEAKYDVENVVGTKRDVGHTYNPFANLELEQDEDW